MIIIGSHLCRPTTALRAAVTTNKLFADVQSWEIWLQGFFFWGGGIRNRILCDVNRKYPKCFASMLSKTAFDVLV